MRYLFLLALLAAVTIFHPAFGQDSIAIVNVTLIDGTDNPSRPNSTVIVQGKKIVAITSGPNKPPTGTKIVDGAGKFLIPGLWNSDLHGPAYDDAKLQLEELLSYGITTVRDMGAPLDDIIRLRDATASGALVGPRLFIAGPLMEGPVPVEMPLIVDLFSERQARAQVQTLKQRNVDYVEVDTTLTPELYWAVADEARKQNLPLVGHIPPKIGAASIVRANQSDVEHLGGRFLNVLVACSSKENYFMGILATVYDDILKGLKEKQQVDEQQFTADFDKVLLDTFDEGKAQRLFRLYAENGVAQTPTLRVLKTLWETNKDRERLNDRDMEFGKKIFAKDLEVVGAMKRAGVPILAGTDGSYDEGGDALHSELELLVEAGLTPLQALQAASRDAAKALGVSKDVGTIELGKTADLVLIDADPLKNISNTRRIYAVILHGQLFSKDQLSMMKNH